MTLDELKERLREELGNPTEARLSDKSCGNAVSGAVKEYSRYRPIRVLDFIGTQKDQPLYSLNDRQRIIRVKTVYYNTGFEWSWDEYFPDPSVSVEGRLEGISLFENPSVWTQYIQRLEQYKGMFDGDFEYDPINKMLRLIPAPSLSGKKVVFVWTQRHTPETILEDDIDGMLLWAKALGTEILAKAKRDEIKSVSGFGQSITMGASYETLNKDAADLKDEFRRKFGGGSFVVIG